MKKGKKASKKVADPPSNEVSLTQPAKKKKGGKHRLEKADPYVEENVEAEAEAEAEADPGDGSEDVSLKLAREKN